MFWKQPPSQVAQFKTPPRSPEFSHQNSKGSCKSPSSSNSLEVPLQTYQLNTIQTPQPQLKNKNNLLPASNQLTPLSCDSDEYMEIRSLPINFEKTIRELELIIAAQETVDIDIVRQLIMLYTMGVEYYDSKSDDKFIYFKNKIVYLHEQQNVIDAMNHSNSSQSSIRMKQSTQKGSNLTCDDQQSESLGSSTSSIAAAAYGSNQFELSASELALQIQASKAKFQQFEEQAQVCITEADVHEILDTQDDLFLEQEILIEKDLKKQNNIIQKRLSKRMKANQLTLASSQSIGSFAPATTPKLIVTGAEEEDCGKSVTKLSTEEPDIVARLTTTPSPKRNSSNSPTEEQPKRTTPSPQIIIGEVEQVHTKEVLHQQQSPDLDRQQIISAFVSDKKRSLQEEMSLKLEQLDFYFEKLMFQKERNAELIDEETKQELTLQKRQKSEEIQQEYALREKQHLDMIYMKYNNAVSSFQASNQI